MKAVRPFSDIIMTANYETPITLEVPLIQRREISLIGHMMYVREDFKDAIQLLYTKKINISKTVGKKFDFCDYVKAFEYADEHKKDNMKIIIEINH